MKACFFDLGNTLSDDAALLEASLGDVTAWLAHRGAVRDPSAFAAAYREANRADFRPFISHTFGEPEFFREAFARLDVRDISPAEALERYRAFVLERTRVDPELPDALEYLASRGLRLGVLSNERADRVAAFLERTGLSARFEVVVVSEAVGVEKPDPRIFGIALERMGTEAAETALFGDNDVADGACRLVGMRFVLVTQYRKKEWVWEKGDAHAPDHVIDRISRPQLERLLEAWRGPSPHKEESV